MWKIIKKILIPKSEKYLNLYKKYGNISFWNKITNTKKEMKKKRKKRFRISFSQLVRKHKIILFWNKITVQKIVAKILYKLFKSDNSLYTCSESLLSEVLIKSPRPLYGPPYRPPLYGPSLSVIIILSIRIASYYSNTTVLSLIFYINF